LAQVSILSLSNSFGRFAGGGARATWFEQFAEYRSARFERM
jgi:hypothetical protein